MIPQRPSLEGSVIGEERFLSPVGNLVLRARKKNNKAAENTQDNNQQTCLKTAPVELLAFSVTHHHGLWIPPELLKPRRAFPYS